MEERIQKLESLNMNGAVYGQTSFPKDQSIFLLKSAFEEKKKVATAGRVITRREHGKSMFLDLADATDKLQVYLRKDILGDESFERFKTQVDIGDILGIEGEFFKTHTGEITLLVSSYSILAKALRILPEKWHGLKDVELRFRKRYVDLIANRHNAELFLRRSKIIRKIRLFLDEAGFVEVETPILHSIPGGAAGRPFITHHNALNMDIYLRIAPELYLKRILVGGFDKIYELNRSFRNEGLSVKHNPEFTMLEVYASYQDVRYMMRLTEHLIRTLVQDISGSQTLSIQGENVDFSSPFDILSLAETLRRDFGIEYADTREIFISKISRALGLHLGHSRSQMVHLIEDLLEKKYYGNRPIFVTDFYTWMSPLAKAKKDNPYVVERFELFIGGMEVANAYSELNNPIEQRRRFESQLESEEELPKKIDDDFLEALEYGMPPAAGLGIGIDRLIMILLGKTSIKEVLFFPLLKPEQGETLDDTSA